MTMLTNRTLLRVAGEGVRDFLQGLVTSDVKGELPVWAGLLTPQGKCLFDFFVFEDGEDLLLDCEANEADALARRLTLYRLRRPIAIARDETLAVHWSPDGDSDLRLPALGKRWLDEPGEEARGYLEHRLRLGVCEGPAELGDLLWLETNAGELHGAARRAAAAISSTPAIAPTPTSPHANALAIGGTTTAPRSSASTASWRRVSGCSHMAVFMAGATMRGLPQSHARSTDVTRLSHRP